jgi:predicted aldo/keto reductase-like oxidoreductase
MRYRTLGPNGPEVSVLGFGAMRLPVLDGRGDAIDEDLARAMVRRAIDGGVNYVDTAFPYHGTGFTEPGQSEPFVGRALADGYRERVLLATKMPTWLIESRDDMERHLEDQLERLATDHIDCYLLHGLKADRWSKLEPLGVLDFLDAALADGRIRYAGFSFHDVAASFAPIADAYDWTFCQLQYNYLDVDEQAGTAGVRHAEARGMGVIVMEPLKGGRLAGRVPSEVQAVFDEARRPRSAAEWALDFVWDDPAVSMLLSGMSTMEQVEQNLASAESAAAGALDADEHALIARAREAFRARTVAECTACRYCMPCPSGVDIPGCFAKLNAASMWDDAEGIKAGYLKLEGTASLCTLCGLCEEACPQELPVRDLLKEASTLFGA